MLWKQSTVASLLATGAYAGSMGGMADGYLKPRGEMVDTTMEEVARSLMERQNSNVVNLNSTNAQNTTNWNSATNEACIQSLSQLNVATNPSGTAVCYNLPTLDNTTGVFQADLRLYQVSVPSGAFTGIPPQNIQVGLQYHGASVSPVQQMTTRDLEVDSDLVVKRQATAPTLLQSYLFVGQIDKAMMTQNPMTMGLLEALVMPTVTLKGVNGQGQTVSTNVSSNEAAFVNGVFSNEIIMSDFGRAQQAVDQAVAGLKNGTLPFVVPGVNILIFPTGLIVIGIWMILGFGAYGYGTYERIQHRESYRRRSARAGKGGQTRI